MEHLLGCHTLDTLILFIARFMVVYNFLAWGLVTPTNIQGLTPGSKFVDLVMVFDPGRLGERPRALYFKN